MPQTFLQKLTRDFRPESLLPSLSAGLIAGIIIVMVQISLAALIFSGDLSHFVSGGIGLTLFGSFVVSAVVALTSSYRGAVGVAQDISAALIAPMAAGIVTGLIPSASPDEKYATVVAAIAVTSLVTGLGFLLMGLFRLGGLIRYIPYPVIGGFLAGTGWLLIKGSIGVMADVPLIPEALPHLVQPEILVKWLPGLLFAVLLYLATRYSSHFFTIPGLLLAATAVFFATMWVFGVPLPEITARGWLLGPFPQGMLWRPLTPEQWGLVHWSAILGSAGTIGTVLLVSAISLLLNASGLELTARQEIDLDHELRSSGLANLLSALGGGTPGFQALSLSALGYRFKANSRLVGLFAAAVCGLTLFFGAPLLVFLPKPVIGGLLFFLGLSFLLEWVYDAWFKLAHGEYAIVLLILVAMNTVGILEGVGLGVLVAVALFVFDYSHTDIVRHSLSGANFRSNVDRPKLYEQLLHTKGELTHIMELRGFIFFGTANQLLTRVRARVEDASLLAPRFIVLDFRQVTGLDASAVLSFNKMKQLAQSRNFVLVFTDLAPAIQRKLEGEVLTSADAALWQVFSDLNHGVEWCEEQIIRQIEGVGLTARFKTSLQQLEGLLPKPDGLERLKSYCDKLQVEAGHILIRQGRAPGGLYFVEFGGAEALLALEDGNVLRLRRMSTGTIVGEVSLYADTEATASVITDRPGTIYFLSTEKLKEMEQQAPELASVLHRYIAQVLSERLIGSTNVLEALLA